MKKYEPNREKTKKYGKVSYVLSAVLAVLLLVIPVNTIGSGVALIGGCISSYFMVKSFLHDGTGMWGYLPAMIAIFMPLILMSFYDSKFW